MQLPSRAGHEPTSKAKQSASSHPRSHPRRSWRCPRDIHCSGPISSVPGLVYKLSFQATPLLDPGSAGRRLSFRRHTGNTRMDPAQHHLHRHLQPRPGAGPCSRPPSDQLAQAPRQGPNQVQNGLGLGAPTRPSATIRMSQELLSTGRHPIKLESLRLRHTSTDHRPAATTPERPASQGSKNPSSNTRTNLYRRVYRLGPKSGPGTCRPSSSFPRWHGHASTTA